MSTEPDTLAAVETETAPLQLLHLDERLAVVNKPAGLMVHDSKLARGEDDFLADRLREQLGRPIFLVHRLDRATSGCLLLAFDRETASALGKALMPVYPELADFHLADYKVRILDGENGTAATTRVLIDTQNGHRRWSTVGASANIIEASWIALVDSVEYGLMISAIRLKASNRQSASGKQYREPKSI